MKALELKDRIVVEICDENVPTNECVAEILHYVADCIQYDGYRGNHENKGSNEILWEHECVEYGGFRISSDKSLIRQYYYGSEPKPLVVNDKLRNEIREYLDSFGDDEQLSMEEMSDLFFRANTLLVKILEGE